MALTGVPEADAMMIIAPRNAGRGDMDGAVPAP
jgi:hypothetical protein